MQRQLSQLRTHQVIKLTAQLEECAQVAIHRARTTKKHTAYVAIIQRQRSALRSVLHTEQLDFKDERCVGWNIRRRPVLAVP